MQRRNSNGQIRKWNLSPTAFYAGLRYKISSTSVSVEKKWNVLIVLMHEFN